MLTPKRAIRLAATLPLVLSIFAAPVAAQGFFQNLFGVPVPPTAPVRRLPSQSPAPRPPFIEASTENRAKLQDESAQGKSRSGNYRTLCVRMCDGYYWPINQSVSRSGFYHDANLCKNSCGTEARLFYHPNASPDVNGMVDLSGRAYSRLPNAFRYRKSLVAGCQCKPEPWSTTELDRHRRYAGLADQSASPSLAKSDINQGIEVIAGAATPRTTNPRTSTPYDPPAAFAALPSNVIASEQNASPDAVATLATNNPSTVEKPHNIIESRPAPTAKTVAVRRRPDQFSPPVRSRQVARQTIAAVRTTAQPKKAPAPGLLGLGAQGVRWPGD